MTIDEAFGETISGTLPTALTVPEAIACCHAIAEHRHFRLIEARHHDGKDGYAETLVVECKNDGVPTRNPLGIGYRERFALTFYRAQRMPEVYALRPDFPFTFHQNHSDKSGFRSLCMNVQAWGGLRRTWTGKKHLDRILWWVAETASGTLHRPGQPLEPLYFQSPIEVVLPHDFDERMRDPGYQLALEHRRIDQKLTLVGRMIPSGGTIGGDPQWPCLLLDVPPLLHGQIEPWPNTLEELEQQFERRGASLSSLLFNEIERRWKGNPLIRAGLEQTLLILSIPLIREIGGEIERTQIKGFVVNAGIGKIGVATGAVHDVGGRQWSVPIIGAPRQEKHGWRPYVVTPVEVVPCFSSDLAREANGVKDKGPQGVLAGVGALGSEILDLWMRSGWGEWTTIDPDMVKPHNLARHRTLECHVGSYKAAAMKSLVDALTPNQPSRINAVAGAANLEEESMRTMLAASELVIDATTTLNFPRDLAADDKVRRAGSVFVTPTGRGAVLLLEDAERTIRLDALEAQYYRRVISQPWGKDHLAGSSGHLWTGAGCRDVSGVIPNELIGMHGANLAGMVRRRSRSPDPALMIWECDPETGAVTVDRCAVAAPKFARLNDLKIVWDSEILEKIRAQRVGHLPNETGGVLLGYFDLVLRRVFIVDALPAPPDSKEEATGFVRGVEGLLESVNEASRRTTNIVGYVGEWHSHPRDHTSNPSTDDFRLLVHLAKALAEDGQPALMLIVGEDDETWLSGALYEVQEGSE